MELQGPKQRREPQEVGAVKGLPREGPATASRAEEKILWCESAEDLELLPHGLTCELLLLGQSYLLTLGTQCLDAAFFCWTTLQHGSLLHQPLLQGCPWGHGELCFAVCPGLVLGAVGCLSSWQRSKVSMGEEQGRPGQPRLG